jgi:hypothetical protein
MVTRLHKIMPLLVAFGLLSLPGCAVVSVVGAGVSVAATVVGTAVGVAGTAVSTTAKVGGAAVGAVIPDSK